jgi:hypothetical protein
VTTTPLTRATLGEFGAKNEERRGASSSALSEDDELAATWQERSPKERRKGGSSDAPIDEELGGDRTRGPGPWSAALSNTPTRARQLRANHTEMLRRQSRRILAAFPKKEHKGGDSDD